MTGSLAEPLVVLVVDDDALTRKALTRLLSRDARVKAVDAADGLEALAVLESRAVDVVISDEVMPGIKGVRLLETIRARWPGTRRVLYTGYPNAELVMDAVNKGGVDKALPKGILPEQLRTELDELISDCFARRVGERNTVPTAPAAVKTSGAISVLLISDELAVQNALATVLLEAGFSVRTARADDVDELLDDGDVNVIVLDLSQSLFDPTGVMRQIRERDLDCPTIVTTPRDALGRAHEVLRYGAHRYLVHPVSRDALVNVVEKAGRLNDLSRLRREAVAQAHGIAAWGMGDRAALEVRFARALEKLYMVYQPIISWTRREIVGYEALVRSEEPTLPHPGALFDVAHRLDGIEDLGRAIRRIAGRPFAGDDGDHWLFLNLHVKDVTCEDLLDSPLASMAERTVLEITERAALDSVDGAGKCIAQLRARGYRIAVDNLGAGYAGLSSFAELEPDIVKLDMSLVRDVHRVPTKQRLVAGLQEACRDLGVLMVSEGIETPEERDALLEAGCDVFQGFLFARPARTFPDIQFD